MACPHLPKQLSKDQSYLIKKSLGCCDVCKAPGPNLWACLVEGCTFVGCSQSAGDHGSHHYEETQHAVAMNLKSFRIWCYQCKKEVKLTVFTPGELKNLKALMLQQKSTAMTGENVVSSLPNLMMSGKQFVANPHMSPTKLKFRSLASLQQLISDKATQPTEAFRGLTGLRNLGNTCYMNAALQSLSNCPQLTNYFISQGKFDQTGRKLSMSKSYVKLMNDMWSGRFASIAPSSVHMTLKQLNPSFRGYQQQDTQEFLRCLMDNLHEEMKINLPVLDFSTDVEPQLFAEEAGGDAAQTFTSPSQQVFNELMKPTEATTSTVSLCTIKNTHELQSKDTVSNVAQQSECGDTETAKANLPVQLEQLHSSGLPLYRSSSMPSITSCPGNAGKNELSVEQAKRSMLSSAGGGGRKRTVSTVSPKQLASPSGNHSPMKEQVKTSVKKKKATEFETRSIISDVFDGQIRSSVQCRTCNLLSHTKEAFQDLSLPIPGKDDTVRLQGNSPSSPAISFTTSIADSCVNGADGYGSWIWSFWERWRSTVTGWLWGPEVRLSDCLSAFFSADELKGDNMYSCEKCKKLRNGIKDCRLLHLPEILCIHLKRFRHEYLTSYSTKISSTVSFPLEGLDMGRYLAKDSSSQLTLYDLASVIVHHGGAGGGHYTSYSKNPLNKSWYEFDDQYITEVNESVVAGAEAYVLFYKKRSVEKIQELRQKMLDKEVKPMLISFYVSVEWMIQFFTFAEPGPVDNRFFLCPHGNVDPKKYGDVHDRVCRVSEQMWHELHERFGGGPVVTRLEACETCKREAELLEGRRSAEYKMFMRFSKSANQHPSQPTYYIGMVWFRHWQDFIYGKEKEPPAAIDNKCILIEKDGKVILNKVADYGEIPLNAWKYLAAQYGGGPAVSASAAPRRGSYEVVVTDTEDQPTSDEHEESDDCAAGKEANKDADQAADEETDGGEDVEQKQNEIMECNVEQHEDVDVESVGLMSEERDAVVMDLD